MLALDKANDYLRRSAAATDPDTKAGYGALARLWLNLANEVGLMSFTEQREEEAQLLDLEAEAIQRMGY